MGRRGMMKGGIGPPTFWLLPPSITMPLLSIAWKDLSLKLSVARCMSSVSCHVELFLPSSVDECRMVPANQLAMQIQMPAAVVRVIISAWLLIAGVTEDVQETEG